jgi:hypothetical protein
MKKGRTKGRMKRKVKSGKGMIRGSVKKEDEEI